MSVAVALKIPDSHYSPSLGRFISEDPIGFRGQDYNLYRYVGNNPLMYRDPYGNVKWLQTIGGFIAVVGGAAVISQSGNAARIHPALGGAVALAGGALVLAGGILVLDGLVDEALSSEDGSGDQMLTPINTNLSPLEQVLTPLQNNPEEDKNNTGEVCE